MDSHRNAQVVKRQSVPMHGSDTGQMKGARHRQERWFAENRGG